MKGELEQLFQARFHGHELPVEPGLWQGIQSQLASAAPASEGVDELFQERFNGHEVDVDPAVWQNISTQLGHTAVVGAASATWGWVAAVAGTAIVASAFYLLSPVEPVVKETTMVEQLAPTAVPQASIEATQALPADVSVTVQEPAAQPSNNPVPVRVEAQVSRREAAQTPLVEAGEELPVHTPTLAPATGPVTTPAPEPAPVAAEEGPVKVERIIEALSQQTRTEALEPASTPSVPTEELEEPKTALGPLPELFIPNVFTPNGDGWNDSHQVIGEGFERILVKVFALKNNQLVFSTNEGEAWTGANCADGMYLVAVEALTPDGRSVTEGKVVWLNRNPMN